MNLSFLKYILRFVLAVAAAWVALRLLGLVVTFGSTFPLWAMALVIGSGCVLIGLFYRRERRLVSKPCGRWLVALRCASFCIAAFILLQPILQRTVTRRIERTVAVLLDVSDSMRFTDDGWNPGERLSLARQTGLVRDKEVLLPSLETFAARMERLAPWLESDMAEGRAPSAFRRLASRPVRLGKGAHVLFFRAYCTGYPPFRLGARIVPENPDDVWVLRTAPK